MTSDVENIIDLLGPREIIGHAIDVLMNRDDLGRDDAFALLVRNSSNTRRTVRESAAEIVQQRRDE